MKCLFIPAIAAVIFLPLNTTGQILNPSKVLERKVVNKTNQTIDKKVQQVVDSAFNAPSQKKEQQRTEPVNKQSEQSNPVANNNKPDQTIEPSLQSYSKFDFIPGEKIIFYDDFSADNIGDFPLAWNSNGSAEVVTTNLFPGKWMKFSMNQCVWTNELLKLPENYTIEFDIIPTAADGKKGMAGYIFRLMQSVNAKAWDGGSVPGKAGFKFNCEYFGRSSYSTYVNGAEGQGMGLSGYVQQKELYQKENQKYHISVWVQKSRVRLYQNENKIIDLPRAFTLSTTRMDRIRFEYGAALISNVRIAVGAADTRSKLITEGKLVSYGIYFDVNKDVVKPESYGSLKSIADVLNENPDVKIRIVGHTDSDGNDAANLDLSKRRAASVKNELTRSFGIDASRIETDGKGETQPVAGNDSPANKALNRRVEFIKQ